MNNVHQLIEHLRRVGLSLKHATRDGMPDKCEDNSVRCYLPAEFVENIRGQCDKFLGLVERMEITPSLSDLRCGFLPLNRAVDHVMKVRYWSQGKIGGDTNVLFRETREELVQPLVEAERHLMEAIRNDQIASSDTGPGLRAFLDTSDASPNQDAIRPVLQDRHRMAYRTWKEACGVLGDGVRLPKDIEAYTWLKKKESKLISELNYKLPSSSSWARYLRTARKRHRDQKNTPPEIAKTPLNDRHFDTPQS